MFLRGKTETEIISFFFQETTSLLPIKQELIEWRYTKVDANGENYEYGKTCRMVGKFIMTQYTDYRSSIYMGIVLENGQREKLIK